MISERIKLLRKKHKLSLDKLASLSGVSKSYLWGLENGRDNNPSITTLHNLSHCLNVPVLYLMRDDYICSESEQLFIKYSKLNVWDRERIIKIMDVLLETQAFKEIK